MGNDTLLRKELLKYHENDGDGDSDSDGDGEVGGKWVNRSKPPSKELGH